MPKSPKLKEKPLVNMIGDTSKSLLDSSHSELTLHSSKSDDSTFTLGEKLLPDMSPLSLPPPSTSPSLSELGTTIKTRNNANYFFRNPNSIESIAVPSPASSLEQFDLTTTPLSTDDNSDASILDAIK